MSGLWVRQPNRMTGSRQYIEQLHGVARRNLAVATGLSAESRARRIAWPYFVAVWNSIEDCATDVGYDIFKAEAREAIMQLSVALLLLEKEAGGLSLVDVTDRDVAVITTKDADYGGSWKRRGGIGAFMMLARKWDRLAQSAERNAEVALVDLYRRDTRPEGLKDDCADLRRYLILVECELRALEGL